MAKSYRPTCVFNVHASKPEIKRCRATIQLLAYIHFGALVANPSLYVVSTLPDIFTHVAIFALPGIVGRR
jgi:hypothetical protein